MRNKEISADKVRLAQVRYFDVEANASEIPEEKGYVFLVNINGTYINPFNPIEEVPVYDRTWYSNTTWAGREFGTKIVLVQGEVQEGICYILEWEKGKDIFDKDVVSLKEIEDYMFESDDFFIDRLEISRDRRWNPKEKLLRYKQIVEDARKGFILDEYLNREKGYQKVK